MAPPEEDAMATRKQPYRQAKTKDVPKEAPRLASKGSKWGKAELQKLGVRFPLKARMDLNAVMHIDDSQWSHAERKRK